MSISFHKWFGHKLRSPKFEHVFYKRDGKNLVFILKICQIQTLDPFDCLLNLRFISRVFWFAYKHTIGTSWNLIRITKTFLEKTWKFPMVSIFSVIWLPWAYSIWAKTFQVSVAYMKSTLTFFITIKWKWKGRLLWNSFFISDRY